MIEIIVAVAFFLGGYEYGKAAGTVPPCEAVPMVAVECPDIYPPENDTFGATTRAYSSLVTQYRKCKTACSTPTGE